MRLQRLSLLLGIAASLLSAAPVFPAHQGLWVGTVTLNSVGRVNRVQPQLNFDLGLVGLAADEPLLTSGATWQALQDGSAPGDDWATGASWPTAVHTPVTLEDAPPAAYYLHLLHLTDGDRDPAPGDRYDHLRLSLTCRDGAAVYLNGQVVLRDNLGTETLSHTAFAQTAVPAESNPSIEIRLPPDLLQKGDNRVAVAVHRAQGETDIAFDLTLTGVLATPAESTLVQHASSDPQAASGADWRYATGTLAAGADWLSAGYDDSSWVQGTAPFATAADAGGTSLLAADGALPEQVYFRTRFGAASSSPWTALRLLLQQSDGAVVYLNGREILRDNLPASQWLQGTASKPSLAAGGDHSLAIAADRSLWAWGSNDLGQLGNASSQDAQSPTPVGLKGNWKNVAASTTHTFAVDRDGQLWAWGQDDRGRLGVDLTADDYTESAGFTPRPTLVDSGYASVAAGMWHAVALTPGGELRTWGFNSYGQLGVGDLDPRPAPTPISATDAAGNALPTQWQMVAAGNIHTLALADNGDIYEWGLAPSNTVAASTPVQVPHPDPLRRWTFISAGGQQSAAIDDAGDLYTWGKNDHGQLGHGYWGWVPVNVPTQVASDHRWESVSINGWAAAGRKADGTIWTWGRNAESQLGFTSAETCRDSAPCTTAPKQVLIASTQGANDDWTFIEQSGSHAVAIKQDGSAWAWGSNSSGQIGDNATQDRATPVRIWSPQESLAATVSLGANHSIAVDHAGNLLVWGANDVGQLGDGTTVARYTPTRIGLTPHWQAVAGGSAFSLGLTDAGELWAWGSNDLGQLGDGSSTTRSSPVRVAVDIASVTAGTGHVLAIRDDGSLWGWGDNRAGQVAEGDTPGSITAPRALTAGSRWLQVAAGARHSLALEDSGALHAWGANDLGQLGRSDDAGTRVAHPENPASHWQAIAAGGDRSVALDNQGRLWTWGDGQALPLQVGSAADWDAVTAGARHTVALKTDGSLWAWGANESGQLGAGIVGDRSSPVRVGSDTDWTAIAAGAAHTVALKGNGSQWAWGDNAAGQLGNRGSGGALSYSDQPLERRGSGEADLYRITDIDLRQLSGLLLAEDNVLAVELHQNPDESAAATLRGTQTRTPAELRMRLLLHENTAGSVHLLKEAYQMRDGDQAVLLATDLLIPAYQGPGRRVSAVGYDFPASALACSGTLAAGAELNCTLELPHDHPTNPFLHRYHPDHDNWDPRYQSPQAEAYTVQRHISVHLSDRYPADPDAPPRSPPPGWGYDQLGGTYQEIYRGLHRDAITVRGWFTLQRAASSGRLEM